ncbi:alpha/beta fold hydrolase [Oceanobacillus sp. 143]|uniref:Lysophospholipase n=1 Tax=Oceanobacillus zhaokaii TaxID=2052660 RepID=A0A345PIW5_9BACI|nr:alpha/beta hydrolase [Oceanobacillus zhaokaii]AXI09945.1 lysophospholipase [Oceanobacillus zhaokaii]QGS69143.1 alpha/beta fold hydrolase [Oceanobacillus sp. 143]
MKSSFWLEMEDGTEIHIRKWGSEIEHPKAIIQLSHGMAEHINRYEDFARFLVEKEIIVYGNDHRGHGKTGEKQGLLGYFSDNDGFFKAVRDLQAISMKIKQVYPDVPIFLFGHSMGSFLVRNYIQTYSRHIDAVILSGTGYFPAITTTVGKSIASIMPPREPSRFMNNLAFGHYNKKIKPKKTDFDWLSNDGEVVQQYIQDPFSGYIPTARFFYDLMTGLNHMQNKRRNRYIRKDLPLLIISGDADPVGNYGKGVWRTAHLYKKAGLRNITTMQLPSARHEILNEVNKAEIYLLLYQWIEKNLSKM